MHYFIFSTAWNLLLLSCFKMQNRFGKKMVCEKIGTQNKNNVLDTCVWNETEERRYKETQAPSFLKIILRGWWGLALCSSRFSGTNVSVRNDKALPSANYYQLTVKRFVDNHSQHLQLWDHTPRKSYKICFAFLWEEASPNSCVK